MTRVFVLTGGGSVEEARDRVAGVHLRAVFTAGASVPVYGAIEIQQEEAAERVLQSEAPATPTHHVIGGEGDPPKEV